MENDAGVSHLLGLFFGKEPAIYGEMISHSFIPSNVMSEGFMTKFQDVMRMHKFIIYDIWRDYFNHSCREMLSSHEKYVSSIMDACLYAHEFNRNIFDSFISAFVLVVNISNEVLSKAKIDFRDLNPDIIMVFYRNVLKKAFPELGGFNGFVDYVRGHRYFEWNWDEKDLNLSDSETTFENFRPDLDDNISKEYFSYLGFQISEGMDNTIQAKSICMAREVLSTSVELPDLPNEHDVTKRLVEYGQKQLANKSDRNGRVETNSALETSREDMSSNSVSKSNYVAQQQEDIARHENIIEAVIRCNRSNASLHSNAKNQKHVEGERTLQHLKNSIESLIEFLDNL